MAGDRHRLRKYKRRKDAARGQRAKWQYLSLLYWRYWHRVYGPHVTLWDKE